jgi:hypothetical protein
VGKQKRLKWEEMVAENRIERSAVKQNEKMWKGRRKRTVQCQINSFTDFTNIR